MTNYQRELVDFLDMNEREQAVLCFLDDLKKYPEEMKEIISDLQQVAEGNDYNNYENYICDDLLSSFDDFCDAYFDEFQENIEQVLKDNDRLCEFNHYYNENMY